MSNVELFSDGDWRNTKLIVDGMMEKFVVRTDIFIGDKCKATIKVNHPTSGDIPFGSLATVKGVRYVSDPSGRPLKSPTSDCLLTEPFEYKNVNIYKVS